jgi:uncharacterized protein YndB with AHSA1/START domain
MKIALAILVVIVAIIVAILAIAMMRPNKISVSRTALIKAQPQIVFALINDFRNWPQWAPQDKEDSKLFRTYGGQSQGVGASSEWKGKDSSGAGSMTIVRSQPYEEIEVNVDFQRPFIAHNVNTFKLTPVDSGTQISWAMEGTNVFMMRLMNVFVSPDRMIGPHFESGLQNLKAVAETQSGY